MTISLWNRGKHLPEPKGRNVRGRQEFLLILPPYHGASVTNGLSRPRRETYEASFRNRFAKRGPLASSSCLKYTNTSCQSCFRTCFIHFFSIAALYSGRRKRRQPQFAVA